MRPWLFSWLLSITLMLVCVVHPLVAAGLFVLFVLGVIVVCLFYYPDEDERWQRIAYFLVRKTRVSEIHFLPPRLLRRVKRQISIRQAFKSIEIFIENRSNFGIESIYIVTSLPSVHLTRAGFKRLFPAGPLDWVSVVIQHRMATAEWNWRWPWLYRLE